MDKPFTEGSATARIEEQLKIIAQNPIPILDKNLSPETFFWCKGTIEYKRHCFSASNTYTLKQKREWCIGTNDDVIHEFLGANGM